MPRRRNVPSGSNVAGGQTERGLLRLRSLTTLLGRAGSSSRAGHDESPADESGTPSPEGTTLPATPATPAAHAAPAPEIPLPRGTLFRQRLRRRRGRATADADPDAPSPSLSHTPLPSPSPVPSADAWQDRTPPSQHSLPQTPTMLTVSSQFTPTPGTPLELELEEVGSDEEDATLEELRAQARDRGRPHTATLSYWRQIKRYLQVVSRRKPTEEEDVAEQSQLYLRFGPKTEQDRRYLQAVRENNVAVMNAALNAGGNPYTTTDNGASAIHVASEANATETLNALLARRDLKLNINLKDCRGFTPLHSAVDFNNWRMTYTLILAGAEVDHEDIFSKTPLHYAVMRGNVRIVKMLLYFGADPNNTDCFGVSPLSMAFTSAPFPDVARALLNSGGTADVTSLAGLHLLSECVLACDSPTSLDALRALLASGSKVNAQEAVSGQTALHFAAITDNLPTAVLLLRLGADSELCNFFGETPLETALVHRSHKVVNLLRSPDRWSVQLEVDLDFLWEPEEPLPPPRNVSKADGSDIFLMVADRRVAAKRRAMSARGSLNVSSFSVTDDPFGPSPRPSNTLGVPPVGSSGSWYQRSGTGTPVPSRRASVMSNATITRRSSFFGDGYMRIQGLPPIKTGSSSEVSVSDSMETIASEDRLETTREQPEQTHPATNENQR